jgi:pilus assembly protein CpaB
MKPKTLILMGTAIVCGLGASYMTSRLLAERGQDEVTKVTVLVAKKHLDRSTQLKKPDELLEPKEFVQGDEPKNALSEHDMDKVKNKFLKRGLRKGDFVTDDDFADNLNTLDVPPGMRAIGLRVNLSEVAGGFASLPGSKVDIISTVRRKSDDDTKTSVLLENVLVLAADQSKDRPDATGAVVASVVTVAVSPEDALRITMAKDLGPLTLSLRNPADATLAEKRSISVNELLRRGAKVPVSESGKFEEPAPTVAEQKPAPKVETPQPLTAEPQVNKHVVTVVEGEHTRKVVFVLNDQGEVDQEAVVETPAVPATPAVAPPAAPPVGPPAAAPKARPRGPVAQAH